MSGLKGKNVLITGGTSGIGQAIAVRFAEMGANVAINYRKRPEDAAETVKQVEACRNKVQQFGVTNVLVQGDVSKEDEVVSMFTETIEKLGGVDILINNAGIQKSGESHQVAVDEVEAVLAVNLKGAFTCAQQALRHFIDANKSGVITNISSVHQIIPKPRFIGYSMSKGGMQNMTRTLALEYAGRGIRVNAVAPGATITPINREWADDPEKRAEVEQHIPLGRPAEADEVAGIAVFLSSDEAAYMTGQTLFVDGGLTLYPDFRTAWSSE
ncbi:MAG: glucose 1-dehydrogenase [Spirochaetia bacterium]|nr:glucose 1-dehydrogenase [Spirochaetia bacterium]